MNFAKYISIVLACASVILGGFQAHETNAADEEGGRGFVLEEIQNDSPSFYVRVSVDHENRMYREGEHMIVTVESSREGYLYLFYENAEKNVSLLYPNALHSENFIQKNVQIQVPSRDEKRFKLRASAPFGTEHLLVVVSPKPIEGVFKNLGNYATSVSSNQLKQINSNLQNNFDVVAAEFEPQTPDSSQQDWAEQLIEITTVAKGASAPSSPNQNKQRVVVLIGIAEYQDSNIPSLAPCNHDIESMRRVLRGDQTFTLLNSQATMENVRKLFTETLPSVTKPGNEVVIFWSGHGNQVADLSGDEPDGKDETLVLYDSTVSDPESQLLDDTFGRWVQALDGRKALVILDACHSAGQITGKSIGFPQTKSTWDFGFNEVSCVKDLGQKDLAVIASSTSSQPSLLRMERDMSVMTYFFVNAMEQQTGWTQSTIFENIRPKVKEYVRKNFYGAEQDMEILDDMNSPFKLN